MATSGTTDFNLDIADIFEEAYELAGVEMRSGYQMKTARRSLNMLMREWGNKGINFWTIRETEIAIAPGVSSVILSGDTIDILDASWRVGTGQNQNDRIMTRMSVVDWSQTANKNQPGSPTQFWVHRTAPAQVHIWPVPSEAGSLVYYGLRSIQDVGSYTNTMDIPPRFLPALTTGLAYYLSLKIPEATERAVILKTEYDRQFQLASEEDRERAPFKLVPDLTDIFR
jgi:hypothetical protein